MFNRISPDGNGAKLGTTTVRGDPEQWGIHVRFTFP